MIWSRFYYQLDANVCVVCFTLIVCTLIRCYYKK